MNDEPRRPPRWPLVLVLGALLVAGFVWFGALRHWWLNSDGSAYLSIGSNFLDTGRFRLPDGDALSWFDRPLYPLLLIAPWTVRRSLEASIWMSRLPLIVAPLVVAAATFRFGRSAIAAAVAGGAALVQPWSLIAGGANFVPDGLTALGVLTAVVCATCAVEAQRRGARWWWLAGALVAILAAAGTKETGLLALVLVVFVLVVGWARPPRWLVVVGVAVLVPLIVALLVIVNGPTSERLVDLPRDFGERLVADPFGGETDLAVVAGLVALALVAWALLRPAAPLERAGLVLAAQGVALGLYASGAGLGQRNAVFLPYGVCLLLGAFVTWLAAGKPLALRAVAVLAGAGVLVLLVAVSVPRAVSADEARARSWDSAVTRAATESLTANAGKQRVACSLLFCSFYWLEDRDLDLHLMPQYSAALGPERFTDLDFDERSGWRGARSGTPRCTDKPLVVTRSDERYGAVFECDLVEHVRCTRPRYLAVSGWNLNDTYDTGRLIPYLEANPAFRRVFAGTPSDWPRVVAVYEVVAPPASLADAPTYLSDSAARALGRDGAPRGAEVLDGEPYRELLASLLTRPAADRTAVPWDDTDREGCAASLDRP